MRKYLLNILIGLIAIIGAAVSIYLYSTRSVNAFIDIEEIVNAFDYKKELEEDLNTKETNFYAQLDSLETQVRILYAAIKDENSKKEIAEYQQMAEQYNYRKEKIDESLAATAQKMNNQMYERINQYVKDYGDENGYNYIFGAQSGGNIMYSKETNDITEEVIKYINTRYQGK